MPCRRGLLCAVAVVTLGVDAIGNSPDTLFHAYCNRYANLRKAFCGGDVCSTKMHARRCRHHYHNVGLVNGSLVRPEPLWIDYCNKYPDLRAGFCNHSTCSTIEQAERCKAHYTKERGTEVARRLPCLDYPMPRPYTKRNLQQDHFNDCKPKEVACDRIAPQTCGPRVVIAGASGCTGVQTVAGILSQETVTNLCYLKVTRKRGGVPCMIHKANFQGMVYPTGHTNIYDINYLTARTTMQRKDFLSADSLQEYSRLLPQNSNKFQSTFELSSSYLDTHLHANITQHFETLLPHSRLIFVLCDPVLRFFVDFGKHMQHLAAKGPVPTRESTFSEWVSYAMGLKIRFCNSSIEFCEKARRALSVGEYSLHLEQWLLAQGPLNLLVLHEDMEFERMRKAVLRHAELTQTVQTPVKTKADQIKEMALKAVHKAPPAMLEWLRDYYKPFNKKLAGLLGESWPQDWDERTYHKVPPSISEVQVDGTLLDTTEVKVDGTLLDTTEVKVDGTLLD